MIQEETDYSCKIIIKNGNGTLIQEFENVAQLLVWKKPEYNMNMYSFKRLIHKPISKRINNQKN